VVFECTFVISLVECVPNVSEGRDAAKVSALAAAIESVPGVALLHHDVGYDANRTVFTFAGEPEAVLEAAKRLVALAADTLDMRTHAGTHPFIGAVDVCPFVPLTGVTMEDCVALSGRLGEWAAETLGIPVYLYAEAARVPGRRLLADVRKGGYAGLAARLATDDGKPDYPPSPPTPPPPIERRGAQNAGTARTPRLNGKRGGSEGTGEMVPTFGALITGARGFLVAWNINVATRDVAKLKPVAAALREKNSGLPGLRCIAWDAPAFGCVQLSFNVTNPAATPLSTIWTRARSLLAEIGLTTAGSELVGLVPEAVLLETEAAFVSELRLPEGRVLESRLRARGWPVATLSLLPPRAEAAEKQEVDDALV
jgi:glutamate formiminotransferase